jgi:nitrite reductase/ring-hydroxylating ferredoxin subunit
VPRLSRDAIVRQLEEQGLRFRTVTVQTEGDYLVADVDWNNKDVLHLNHVHRWANDVTCVMEADLQATVSLQEVLGITCPVIIVHYDSAPGHQTHFFTLGPWSVVTDIEFVEVTPTRTRTVTSYAVGAKRLWMLAFPVIRALLRRNYRQLMSEDVPMRERRGLLRSWGYTFRGDDEGPRDLRASLAVQANNVVHPGDVPVPDTDPVPIGSIGEVTRLGRSDHLGLQVRRQGGRLLVHPRLCPHEGADLDGAALDGDCLVCPWHGRRLPPLAELDLAGGEATTPWHHLAVEDGALHVEVDQAAIGS